MASTPYEEAHKDPQGPGDARPTAVSIIEDQGLMGGLQGRAFCVTGANSGIGLETVRALAGAGAYVVCAVRNMEKASETLKEVEDSVKKQGHGGQLKLMQLDLNSLVSVRSFAREFLSTHKQLNTLICNAGTS